MRNTLSTKAKRHVPTLLAIFVVMLLLKPMTTTAQSLQKLWEDVLVAQKADKPKTAIECLEKIVSKAEKEKAYGHLMRAELMIIQAKTAISPDSLAPAFFRLVEKAEAQKKPLQKAVYYAVLGKTIENGHEVRSLIDKSSSYYYKLALADPLLLSKAKAEGYEPLVVKGDYGNMYDHDLLSVIAHEADKLKVMLDCYNAQPKRRTAAMMATLEVIKSDAYYYYNRSYDNYPPFRQLDSLINKYGDLPECCEAAILKYNLLDRVKGVTDGQRSEMLKSAIERWGKYSRCDLLRNELDKLENPRLEVVQGYEYVLPGKPKLVKFPKIKGVNNLKVEITRAEIGKDTQYSLYGKTYWNMLEKYGVKGSHKVLFDKTYPKHEAYEVFSDSVWIEGMPAGVYFIDYITDNNRLDTIHNYFHVTDIALMMQPLPKGDVRLAVLNSTTGQPMPNAYIDYKRRYAPKDDKPTTVNCNQLAEYVVPNGSLMEHFFAYTDNDWGYRTQDLKRDFRYNGEVGDVTFFNIFTDRSIYRPGQTVHMAAVSVENEDGLKTKVISGKEVTIELANPKGKVIETKKAVTDAYGTVHTDFTLPGNGLNGRYSIKVNNSRLYFNVEEYKRPTFFVEIEKPETGYQNGDTLTLVGEARTYSGIAVQGAKVAYTVNRSRMYYWWRHFENANNETELLRETVTTDQDGKFKLRVPIKLPSESSKYGVYNFNVSADVTDMGGETHNALCSLPLGSNPYIFFVDMPDKVLRDSLKNVTFTLLNAVGKPVDAQVEYTVDAVGQNGAGQLYKSVVPSNKPTAFTPSPLQSGAYRLTAVCKGDTIYQKFVVFDINDTKPATKTNDWFYVSGDEFPRDGKPVYVQVGTSDENVHVLYTVVSGEKVIDMGHINLSNAVKTLSYQYKDEYKEGINVAMCWVKDTVFHSHQVTIKRPMPVKKLKMEWTTFRDKLTPGQKETWTLRVKQSDGKPANAQVMATLYDKSLDQIAKHNWSFDHKLRQNFPSSSWSMGYIYDIKDSEVPKYNKREVKALKFDHFDDDIFDFGGYRIFNTRVLESKKMGAMPVPLDGGRREVAQAAYTEAGELTVGKESEAEQSATVSPRTNLNETAFFYPTLATDATGQIVMKFTLPEALTTWRFMGLAHDKSLNIGMLEGEAIASKTVMVQPNMPRFIRQNDGATITTRIANTSDKVVSGNALMELVDPATEKVLFRQQKPYKVGAKGSSTVTYDLSAFTTQASASAHPLICRIIAQGNGYSDGEQHYLPILPDVELVTNTRTITQHEPSEVSVDLNKLFANTQHSAAAGQSSLTIEYAENPAWMMVQTLPSMAADPADNAISMAATYYANSIAGWMLNSTPAIQKTIQQWNAENKDGKGVSLASELQKNPELKSILLEETPWMLDANNESDRMALLADYFNGETLQAKLDATVSRLKQLQQGNGGFAWMNGMYPSLYTTQAVAHILARLNALLGNQEQVEGIFNNALGYIGTYAQKEVDLMQKIEKTQDRKCYPSEFLIDYLYVLALNNAPSNSMTSYLVSRLKEMTADLTIYGKAAASLVLARFGEMEKAREFLESMIEYSVYTDEKGRYFDTRRAYSSWFDYKIPTSVACIEAMKMVDAKANEKYIEEMQRWLLQEKRTQAWDTPVNSVNAVYAFLKDNLKSLEPKGEPAQIMIDGKAIKMPAGTAGMGYVKTREDASNKNTLTVRKTSKGTSWGSVYAQFYQPMSDIEASQEGMTIKRELVSINGKPVSSKDASSGTVLLNVGDRIKMRITIVSDRDYDFVQIHDKRAACLEPVSQVSGYRDGCYVSPRDNVTNYFYDQLPKGKCTIETEYFVDRAGKYQSGSITMQCAYAPAFAARDKAITFVVK